MSSEHANGSDPDRRRPSRWRRLGRSALWCLGGLGVLLLGTWLVFESDWAQEKIHRRVVAEIGEALGREVAIAKLDFDLLPPSVEIEQIVIGGPQGLDPPLAVVDRLTIRAGPGLLRSLLGDGPVVFSEIVVTRPLVSIVFYEDGSSNLPDLPDREPTKNGGLEVRIGALDLRDGELRLDERTLPLDFSAARFEASLRELAADQYHLVASSSRLRVDLPDGTLSGSLTLQADLSNGGVELSSLQLSTNHSSAEAEGTYRSETLHLDIRARADLEDLTDLGLAKEVVGVVDLEARLDVAADSWSLQSHATSQQLDAADLAAQSVEMDASVEGNGKIWAATVKATSHQVNVADVVMQEAEIDGTVEGQGNAWSATATATSLQVSTADVVVAEAAIEGTFRGRADAWSVTAMATSPQLSVADLTAQKIALEGTLEGSGDAWSISGTAVSPLLTVADRELRQVEIGVDGSDQALAVRIQRADLPQGGVRGTIDLPTRAGSEVGLDLTIDGIDLATLLEAVDAPVVGLEGLLKGRIEYRFTADSPALGRGQAQLQVEAPTGSSRLDVADVDGSAGFMLLEGTIPLSIADGTLTIGESRLTAPGQRISLAGAVNIEDASVTGRFGLESEDPRAVLRLLPAIYATDASPLWEPSRGHGVIDGTFSADPSGFRTDFQLELLSTVVTGSPVPRVAGAISLDSAGIQDLHLELTRDSTSLDVRATVPFEEVPGFAVPEFRVDLEMNAWNVADAEPWLDLDLPFDGKATGTLWLGGSIDAPSGRLVATVTDVAAGGLELDAKIRGEIHFDADLVKVGPLRISAPAGDLELAGTFAPQQGALDFRLRSSPLDLSAPPFDDWFTGLLVGVVELSAEIGGTLESPELTARLTGSGLALASRTLGDSGASQLDISWTDGRLDVTGSILGLLEANGGGRLDEVADLKIALEAAGVRDLLELVLGQAPDDLDGHFAGSVLVSGPTNEPRIEARIDTLQLASVHSRLVNLEPVVLSSGDNGLRLESLYLAEEGTGSEIFAQGDLSSAEGQMDLRVVSTIDAAWLSLYLPDLELRGTMELLAVVRGTADHPKVDGQARLADGRLIVAGFPHAVDQIEGYAFFYPDRVVIDSGRARFASGELKMSGDIVSDPQGKWNSELRFSGADLDLRYPEDWRIRGDARLVLSTTPTGSTLSGIAEIETAAFARDFELGFQQLLRLMLQRRPELVAETDDFLVTTQLNIAVDGPEALRIQTNLADLRGDLAFSVRGTMALPVILGEISLARGGEVDLGGNQYQVERGVLTFSNPFRNDPHVDLIASSQIKSYDVRLNVFGPADDLQTSMSSTPPISSLDIVSLLTTGSTDTLSGFGSTSVTDGGGASAEAFLAGQAASLAGQRVGNILGLDQVQITPLTGGSANLSTARVTVGRRISRDVFVTYSHDPSESEEGIVEVLWQMYPSIALILTRSDDGSMAVDLRWDKTF